MDTEIQRTLTIAGLMLAIVGGGMLFGSVNASWGDDTTNVAPAENYTAAELLEKKPYDQKVTLVGPITKVLDDYISDKGYTYQQWLVGENEQLKVFCSTQHGRVNVTEGERIAFTGTFQEFYGTLEVYGQCQNLERH